MNPFLLSGIIFMIVAVFSSCLFADENTKFATPVDFENDLIPVFTKMGCNAAACHGAAIGRGGFKLSLFGGNPKGDYDSILHEIEGRRVNLAKPEKSLLLLKPTAMLPHGGGYLLDDENEGTQLLLQWIQQGAGYVSTRALERVEINPKKFMAEELGASVKLQAVAHYSDGTSQDVTKWTVFAAEDPSAVKIDPETGLTTVQRKGRHIVIARYLNAVVPMELIVPLSDVEIDLSNTPTHNFIDEEIISLLSTLKLPVSTFADDATFLRRITLDLTGRLPKAESVKAFLADSDPFKRDYLVDELLASDECNEYVTLQLAKLFRVKGQRDDIEGARVYYDWLYQQISNDEGYDKIARNVIMALGDTHEVGPANFYRTVNGPREQAEFMSELFMASRMRCANCHSHPLDRWTQDDYHGLAAIFAKIENGEVVKMKTSGEVIHPQTTEPAVYRIPGERFLPVELHDAREELVNWLVNQENPYFAKAIVNRLWKMMMGRGLVEPSDDLRDTNPATHPVLLTKLANDFVENGYKLKHTLRLIVTSASYSRSTITTPDNENDDRYYSHTLSEPLEPEVLADAISDVLGIPDQYGDTPEGTRAVSLFNPQTPSLALDILGRCGREESCETSSASIGGLTRMLHLLNGELLNERIGAENGRLEQLIADEKSPMEIVNEFYLAALSRTPSDTEKEFWKTQFVSENNTAEQQALLEDFVWSLLTCNEFQTNH